jgi:hypothetical protein
MYTLRSILVSSPSGIPNSKSDPKAASVPRTDQKEVLKIFSD